MRHKRIKLLIAVLLLDVSGAILFAQQKISQRQVPTDFSYPEASATVEVEKPYSAKSLFGIVEVPNGGGLSNVLVERVSSDWNTRLDAVFSDSDGRFSFRNLPRGTYYLKLSKSGFSTLRVRVILRKKSKSQLKFSLPLGI
jgi:Carboxypeptidase regulatory-like domain